MYPEELVAPMRADLTVAGFNELKTAEEVDLIIDDRDARPGVKLAVQHSDKKPQNLTTVFAGVDQDAVAKAREYTLPYPPSSPSIGLFKDGELVHFVERHHIEGRSAEMIANHLAGVFEEFC